MLLRFAGCVELGSKLAVPITVPGLDPFGVAKVTTPDGGKAPFTASDGLRTVAVNVTFCPAAMTVELADNDTVEVVLMICARKKGSPSEVKPALLAP